MRFSDIQFGFASAEAENARDPDLLDRGFLDPGYVIREAITGPRFLFLGYKGSGKSAIARHLSLQGGKDPNLFVTLIYLDEFPYDDLTTLATQSGGPHHYPIVWSWLALLMLLESFESDQGGTHSERGNFDRTIQALKAVGLLPGADFAGLLEKSGKLALKLSVIPGFEGGYESAPTANTPANIPFLVQKLKRLVSGFRSESKHLLIIDGLDDVLCRELGVLTPVSALIREAERLNTFLTASGVSAKVIVLSRTELFARLPGPNTNKIRQDWGVQIDWYHDTRNPQNSLLVQLANLRASLSLHRNVDIFKEFLPDKMHGDNTAHFLLDQTRHTPRDFLQLLKQIQRYSTSQYVTPVQISNGLREYSRTYFFAEIHNELDGYFERSVIDEVFTLIRSLAQRRFQPSAIEDKCQYAGQISVKILREVLNAMFECSALGNYTEVVTSYRASNPGARSFGTTLRYTFRFRNPGAVLNFQEGIVIHRGLWNYLNLFAEVSAA